jgi:hypothetical protein
LVQGQAEKGVLVKHGLADKLLEDLAAAVDEFDGSVTQSNEGRRRHVGASARPQRACSALWKVGLCAGGLERPQLMRMSLGGTVEFLP